MHNFRFTLQCRPNTQSKSHNISKTKSKNKPLLWTNKMLQAETIQNAKLFLLRPDQTNYNNGVSKVPKLSKQNKSKYYYLDSIHILNFIAYGSHWVLGPTLTKLAF